MKLKNEDLLLYGVTDRSWVGEKSLMSQIQESLEGGITCIQIREKNLADEKFKEEAIQIKELVDTYKVPFIINDNVSIAVEIGASGVHIGQKDMEIEKARKLLGDNMILGVSAATVEEAIEAEKKGADYLGVGAIFVTSTKQNTRSVSKELLKQISDSVRIPVVAIGGINETNIDILGGTGINGVAVVSAIYGKEDIKESTINLKKQVAKIVG